ncbi:PREDICTED: probable LRR receptor-like serine/threonine-protein kinase At4g36180 isoform X3 [Populus euphratica]|uniref:Probable LRR receptor-like serine/threonine-protein kinase At4g36180 isoform X3 n=1 Tax=Populus euphratica TaxID=75702 RepID=A0AAJ6TFG8_POPEU|nr:PREDICTED: probable LRR receptor-like serine/threonine-protein kinase At4g36180 isoform X3 [Populus euphratica]
MGLFLQMLTVFVTTVSLQGWLPLGCLDEERIALLQLKDSLNYPNGTSLPSWIEADANCCSWERIKCDSSTGRVIALHLEETRNEVLGDWYLNTSLFLPFQQLNALALWGNRIAGWVEKKGGYELQRLRNLDYLDLGSNSFDNGILSFVEGFPSLKSLYLYYNRLEGLIDLKGSLSGLEVLGFSGNNVNKLIASRGPSSLATLHFYNVTTYENSSKLLQSLGAFPNLTTLYLRYNDFRGRILGDELQNLSSLESLYLDYCSLDEHFLQSLGALPSLKNLSLQALSGNIPYRDFLDLKNLEYLDLSYNTLNNSIFQAIRMMTSLKYLNLHGCKLDGQIPIAQGLCDLNHLQELYMYDNDLSGFLPPCLTNLTSLQLLDLSFNHLKIPISLSPLYNLSKLTYFDGSNNEIYAEEDDHNLSPKFQLEFIFLSSRGQGAGAFPKFLYHQFNLQSLDFTNIQIKGEFPNWLIENNTYLHDLSLENCSLSGPFLLPKNSHMNLSFLSISMNYFQGQIPSEIGAHLSGLKVLFMSDNGLNGSIPFSMGNISSLQVLDLSNNSLQGHIPRWIGNMSSLKFLDLSVNNFSGRLPPRFDTASSNLRYVYLSRNKLQGPITKAFYNSSEMFALDLSHNNLTGSIPKWIDRLSNLRFLLLSYNNLEGEIPVQLYRLDQLTLIDLSHNHLSGNILSWMISTHPFPEQYNSYDDLSSSQQSFEFTTKNVSLSYRGTIIQYFTGIDLSCNNFIGEIPPEIGNLSMIKVLNLSHNSLTGPIPPTFSNLKEIESLDLSYNKLDGEIPPHLIELFYLEFFNVAHNNLSGKTPARVAQFATFEKSCYKDNPFLCGEPLPKICSAAMPLSPTPTSTNNEDDGGFMDMEVFYVTFGVTYIIVLLVIGAILYINSYWRRAWFHFIEASINNCYYFLVDNLPILSKF